MPTKSKNGTPIVSRTPHVLAAALLTAALLSGCSAQGSRADTAPPTHGTTSNPTPSSTVGPTPAPTAPASVGTSATAVGDAVTVYDAPNGHVVSTLSNPIPAGAPLTFLVDSTRGGWLKVDLAQRPNGSTGWVKADSVSLHSLVYSLHVSTETNTMTLSQGHKVIGTFSVATGTGGTPTPDGSFYLTELLAPTNPGYGPYAFGLSAFSTALSSFGGGPGQIGLHGTDDASSIGRSASHGCIRLSNDDITTLAKLLPLGTPIVIE